MNHSWLSLHFFHHGDLDRLLVECVGPLVLALKREGAIAESFFLRYWNGGPHIRLRLAVSPEIASDPWESLGPWRLA